LLPNIGAEIMITSVFVQTNRPFILERPSVDDFPCLLFDWRKWDEITSGLETKFFLEFPLGNNEQILVGRWLAFGNGPHAIVFILPVRATRMDQQHFETTIPDAIHQQASALVHPRQCLASSL
jgi:hypothetical protein